jgi:hypothetical protein
MAKANRSTPKATVIPFQRTNRSAALTLVPNHVSSETVDSAKWLLCEAMAGRVIGLAFVALQPMDKYNAAVCGEAQMRPTFTRGMLAALDDHLGRLIAS